MKELDLLLARYVDQQFCSASNAEQEAFRRLLRTEDSVLYGYCLGTRAPPPQFAPLIERITAAPIGERNPAQGR